jgi:hypothetical protein
VRAQLISIFLFLVDSIIAAILSSISTVKSLSIMASVSPEEILNYPVRYYARKSGAPNISRWVDGLKLLKVCWIYIVSEI